jgi:hypothetical protein
MGDPKLGSVSHILAFNFSCPVIKLMGLGLGISAESLVHLDASKDLETVLRKTISEAFLAA